MPCLSLIRGSWRVPKKPQPSVPRSKPCRRTSGLGSTQVVAGMPDLIRAFADANDLPSVRDDVYPKWLRMPPIEHPTSESSEDAKSKQ